MNHLNSIAIYSANFGNYRNEIEDGIDNIFFDKNIDYYFFTDNVKITSNKWNVILQPLQPKLDFIDSFRHTSKYLKFVVPKILHKYDIIIWVDSSFLLGKVFAQLPVRGANSSPQSLKLLKCSNEKIMDLFAPLDYSFFILRHPRRKTAQQEIKATCNSGQEDVNNGNAFLNKIRNIKFNIDLPETGCLIYKNTPGNISILQCIYNSLMANGLRRDQNVIQHVFLENNYESNVSYFAFGADGVEPAVQLSPLRK